MFLRFRDDECQKNRLCDITVNSTVIVLYVEQTDR